MIMLTKLNDEKIILNCEQVEAVEFIPEAKVISKSHTHSGVKPQNMGRKRNSGECGSSVEISRISAGP